MKKKIIIRLVAEPNNIADETIEILNKLELQTFGKDYNCEKSGVYWWIAYHKNIPVGFSGLCVSYNPDYMFLYRTGVLKDYRGNNLQKRFIRVREQLVKKLGYHKIITYTSYTNIVSANNLIECGYKLYKPKIKWGVGYALYFQKEL